LPIDPSTAFVSYSREDLEFTLRLTKDLKARGAKVWMDKVDIRAGQVWEQAIEDAVRVCRRMIVVLSPASVNSKRVKVEVSSAFDEDKEIIPVLLRDCEIPRSLRLFQYADFRSSYDDGLEELLASLNSEHQPAAASAADRATRARPSLLSRTPTGKKVALAGCAILVVGLAVYWASRQKQHEAATQTKEFRSDVSTPPQSPPRNIHTQEIIDQLNNQLTEDSNYANRDRPDLGFSPWTEAQMAVALQGTDVFDKAELAQWFHKEAGACHCWRAGVADRENVAATAWVLLAFARLEVRPSPEEVAFLLDNQHRAGWWQVYPAVGALRSKALEDPRNASTYSTSFSIFALQELLKHKLITEVQQPRLEKAIAKGRSWLLSNTVPGQPGRWKDYPNGDDAHVSIGISGIVLHSLHRTPGLPPTVNDTDWMAELPADLPAAGDVLISGEPVRITLTEIARDGTHMFAYPWLIIGTLDAYPQGDLAQRAQAIRLMNDTPRERDAVRLEAQNKSWVAAEFLIALRYLRGDAVL